MEIRLDALMGLAGAQLLQVTAVALVAGLLARLVGRRRPHLAYVLWLLVIVKCVSPPIWSSPTGVFSWVRWPAAESVSQDAPAEPAAWSSSSGDLSLSSSVAQPVQAAVGSVASERTSLPAKVSEVTPDLRLAPVGPSFPIRVVLAVVWLSGTLIYLAMVLAKILWWRSVIRESHQGADDPLRETVERLAQRLGLRRNVRLLVTSRPLGPAVLGIVRPTVLLPEVLAAGQPVEKVEPIVAHELIHVRRHDVAVGVLQVVAQSVWWFHPLVWWASRALCHERERCCDAEVVGTLDCPRQQYAQGLLDVLRLQRQLVASSVLPGINPFQITQLRLETVMNPEIRAHRHTPWGYWLIFLAGLLVALPGAMATGSNEESPTASLAPAALRGAWQVESEEPAVAGAQAEKVTLKLTIDATTIIMRRGRQLVAETPYTLDAGHTPPTIAFRYNGQPMHGICGVNGDRLTMCLAPADKALPKKFEPEAEGGLLLVLVRVADKVRPIYVMDVDGKNLRPLVSVPEYTWAGSPRWSPDGKRFAFDACRPGFEEGFTPYSHVFVANADGTGLRDLGDGAMPSWSGDGRRLTLCRYGVNRGVWIMNADGSRAELLDERGWGAAWSPTAPRVAYTVFEGTSPNIRVRDLDRPEGRTVLTRRYVRIHYSLCWSPDGQWIALRGATRDDQSWQFAAVHVEGESKGFKVLWPAQHDGSSTSPLPEGSQFCGTVAWTADGRRLLAGIFAPDGRSSKLYFLDVAQRQPPQLLPGQPDGWRIFGLDLSPDGKKISLNGSIPPPQPEWASVKLIGNEMLANPSFDTRMTGWHVYCASPGSVTGVRDTAVYDTVPAAARATCTAATRQSIQVFTANGMSITAGQWYLLRFRAKSTRAFTVPAVTLHKETSPWTSYATPYFNQPSLTKDWATYHVLFQATATVADARLAFNLGVALPVGGSLYIDTLSLRQCQFPGGQPWPDADAGK
jgi:uncharacterized protein (TIGR03067 family)